MEKEQNRGPLEPGAAPAGRAMELHQRAPTLVGGVAGGPGAGGIVKVRGCSRAQLHKELSLIGMVGALVYWTFHQFLVLAALLFCWLGIAWVIALLMRPGCVITDDAGIAVTRRRKGVYLRWEEICGVEHSNGDWEALRLKLNGRRQENIDLGGFGRKRQREILRLITQRAGLEPEVCPRRLQITCAHWKRRRTPVPWAEL